MAPQPPRVIRLVRPPDEFGVGVFAITSKKGVQFYVFKEIPSEIGGRGFVVHRLGLADVYHVRIAEPAESSCECLGFLRHGRCKHVQGLAALIGHGMLPE
ncbi:MAG: hypothetical protein HYX68_07745 [Planctomycetes bacterium]|nr:hypothetical protein [Planctomycetota bacterium]